MENNNEYFVPINEVAKRLDVPAHTLRYWEKQFASAIRPTTGAGGRRYYRADTIEKLQAIKSLLYDKGMTIAGVKKIIHNGTFKTETQSVSVSQSRDIPAIPKPQISELNMGDIDSVITLLKQAKSLLD